MLRPRLLFLLFVPILLCVLVAACFLLPGRGKSGVDGAEVPAGALAVAIPTRMYAEPQICAVTGQAFSISRESRSAIYRGRTYYFRDETALKTFLADPEGYVPDPIPSPARK